MWTQPMANGRRSIAFHSLSRRKTASTCDNDDDGEQMATNVRGARDHRGVTNLDVANAIIICISFLWVFYCCYDCRLRSLSHLAGRRDEVHATDERMNFIFISTPHNTTDLGKNVQQSEGHTVPDGSSRAESGCFCFYFCLWLKFCAASSRKILQLSPLLSRW